MASPERVNKTDSSWNDDMPWGFYAEQQGDATQETTDAPEAILELVDQDQGDIDDARDNHRQYRERDWS